MISYLAGQLVPAASLNVLAPIYAVKASDQSVTNSATLVNDNDISFSFLPNQTIHVQAYLLMQASSAAPGMRNAWSSSGLTSSTRVVLGPPDAGSPAPDNMQVQSRAFSLATNNLYAMSTINSTYVAVENLIVTTGLAAATLQLQFAEFTATASTTVTLKAGTFAIARYVA